MTSRIRGGLPDIKQLYQKKLPKRADWRQIGDVILAQWGSLVDKAADIPASWKIAYKRCLRVEPKENGVRIVFDIGPRASGSKGRDRLFASIVEFGIAKGEIDLKEMVLKGRDYVNVPIEHARDSKTMARYTATPHTIPEFRGKPAALQRALKELQPGERFAPGQIGKLSPRHTSGVLDDAIKQSQAYHRRARPGVESRWYGSKGGVMTFRRLSKNSDPEKWRWPGKRYKAHHFSKKVRAIASRVIRQFLAEH